MTSRSLETVLAEIRATTESFPEETPGAYYQRTYHLGLLRWEQERQIAELPRVQEQLAKSRQASRRAGKPEKELAE